MVLSAQRYQLDDDDAVQAHFRQRGWTDGLPVVAPTPARVQAMLEWAGMPAEQILGVEAVKARTLTAEKVAINAVLAGCLPPDFPVVAAAVEALCQPQLLVHGATASTGGCAILLVVNGPIRRPPSNRRDGSSATERRRNVEGGHGARDPVLEGPPVRALRVAFDFLR
jgi:hypothetical protein